MTIFSRISAQELPTRWRVEVDLEYSHGRSAGKRRRLQYAELAAVDLDSPCVRLLARSRCEREARNGRDARQRFATKAQRGDRLEVTWYGDLRGRVARNRKLQIFALDSLAVVRDADQLDSTTR